MGETLAEEGGKKMETSFTQSAKKRGMDQMGGMGCGGRVWDGSEGLNQKLRKRYAREAGP